MNRYAFLTLFFLLISISLTHAQDWPVDSVRGAHQVVEFTTDEGTWMNLDVSPDGKEIVFDIMGDIYIMPITGGKAKLLKGGLPYEVQPRFSPDGKKISFTSDRGGGDNIWIMDRDGENARQVTKESFRLLNNAVWTPDGEYLVARKHFTSTRSLGAGEMWIYHNSGGSGVQLTKKKNKQQDAGEPWVSPDGRYVYFSEDMAAGGYFKYNKDPNGVIYMVRRYDREKGKVENVINSPGGAVRPQISHDGRYLAYVKRVRLKTVLYLHDLKTGEEWPIYDKLNKDQQETWAIFGVYPNFQWTPDDKSIIIWAQGKIKKIDVESRKETNIPFEVDMKQVVMDAVGAQYDPHPKEFEAKMIRHAITSPDGNTLIFHAAGHLYTKKLPNGKPTRLTKNDEWEYWPSVSPDGSQVAYTTWSDENTGAVKIIPISGGSAKAITPEKGFYHYPRWSPDGKKILYRKAGGNTVLGTHFSKRQGLYLYTKDNGGETHWIKDGGGSASFSPDGKRIWFVGYEGENYAFKSCDLNGEDEQTLFTSKYANYYSPSPDGKWLAFRELYKAYVVAIPPMGNKIDLTGKMGSVPVYQVSRDVGDYLHWSGKGKDLSLHWMVGPEYYSRKLSDCFEFVEGKDSLPPMDTTGTKVGLTLQSDMPEGMIALTNARIITMKGDEVIEKGTVLVEGNRIKAIGADVNIPGKAKVIDCAGKTITPGIVDVHAHLGTSWNGMSPTQQWSYYASIAYGTTTSHDPSANTEMVFSQSEMVRAGKMVGPRIFSTGTILYGADGDFKAVINSLDDARSHLRRMKAVGAFSVKSYNQPRRDQRQQVIQAARELDMRVYPEGGSFFFHNMTQVLDGHTGIEHVIPVAPVYKDVATIWGKSQTGYTPTLIVGYGGIWGENYWYQKTNVWENERLLTFYPRGIIDSRSRRRMMIPDDDFGHIKNAEAVAKIMKAGTKVNLGAHGQLHGLGAHWEMWMFVQGGFSEMEALRASTLWGAEYIGMGKDIGSLEPGKLADLVVMDKNPLENIRNSEFISYTMMNGRLYDAATMNEIGNYDVKREPFFWERYKGSTNFPWHESTGSCMESKCSCTH